MRETGVCLRLHEGMSILSLCCKVSIAGHCRGVNRAQQKPHVRSEPAPTGSKKDLLLDRVELVSDAGWATGREEKRKGRKKKR